MSTLIFGHRNPDSDSCISATALAYLKQLQGIDAVACRLGALNTETQYIYDHFKVEPPRLIEDVKTQVLDIEYDKFPPKRADDSVFQVFSEMQQQHMRTMAITQDDGKLIGVVTVQDIAMAMISGDIYGLHTSVDHLCHVLNANPIFLSKNEFAGQIRVVAYYHDNEKLQEVLQPGYVIIVGDRFDVIEMAINSQVELILVTGSHELPERLLESAKDKEVSIICCGLDTYTTAKRVSQCNFIDQIMTRSDLKSFVETAYLDVVLEEIKTTNYSNYPIVDKDYRYLGLISRRNILGSRGKPVILVDHNEAAQSATGIEQAEILEIYDHHKIGDVATSQPIHFRNLPVGSTSTIIYLLYKEQNRLIPQDIGGLLFSGIISDTLFLSSPTTTETDIRALNELEDYLGLNASEFAKDMFTAGTALGDSSIEELFYRDYKLFEVAGKQLGIAQIYTLDIATIHKLEPEIKRFLQELNRRTKQFLTMLVVTDIYAKGSYIYYMTKSQSIVNQTFDSTVDQGSFIAGVVSRKKQIVPRMMMVISQSS